MKYCTSGARSSSDRLSAQLAAMGLSGSTRASRKAFDCRHMTLGTSEATVNRTNYTTPWKLQVSNSPIVLTRKFPVRVCIVAISVVRTNITGITGSGLLSVVQVRLSDYVWHPDRRAMICGARATRLDFECLSHGNHAVLRLVPPHSDVSQSVLISKITTRSYFGSVCETYISPECPLQAGQQPCLAVAFREVSLAWVVCREAWAAVELVTQTALGTISCSMCPRMHQKLSLKRRIGRPA